MEVEDKKYQKTQLVSRSSAPVENKLNNTNGDQREDRSSNQMRICPHCNKQFSSGKALGGHMRIHLPVKKTQQSIMINQQSNNNNNPTCSICGKKFPSMKSLFGHMRCHPEREWRGIQPPAEFSNSVNDDQVDLMQSLPCWSVTGIRGRRGTVPVSEPSSSEEDQEDEKFHNAAGELLLLAQIDSIGSNVTEIEDRDCYRSKKRVIEGDYDSPRVCEMEYPVAKGYNEYEDEFGYLNGENTKVLKKVKKMRLTVELASFDSPDKYKCTTCNKCFPTHQALGGHRSSHNKFKITTINTIDESSSAAAAAGAITGQEYYQTNNIFNNRCISNPNCIIAPHQCKICKKIFSTGQALGGHKRCHWTGLALTTPLDQAESAVQPIQPSRRVLDFDLNEVPTIDAAADDDEDEHAGGFAYDYALSSYNSNLSC